MVFYMLKKDNCYIGIDLNSGGYPYETPNMLHAEMWKDLDDCNEYNQMFKDNGYSIVRIEYKEEVIL